MNWIAGGEPALLEITESEFFSEAALGGVFELNQAAIAQLIAAVSRPASEVRPQPAIALGPTLLALGSAARRYLARCPVALVEVEFSNIEWWQHISQGREPPPADRSSPCCFPHLQAMQLAQTTLTLAWTVVGASRESAAIIFGLAPECATLLRELGVPAIQRVAETYSHHLRLRWETDIRFWRALLRIAQVAELPEQPRLPPIGTYVLQRQFANLVPLPPAPATPETVPPRASHR
jgi:hypothetical protein